MQALSQLRYSRRAQLSALGLAILVIVLLILVMSKPGSIDKESNQPKPTADQIMENRESARVYIGNFEEYRDDVDPKTRLAIEKMLYNYSYILEGNNLYTGKIQSDSYKMKRLSDNAFDLQMLVDIAPTDITYKVSVIKDKNTEHQQAFLVSCASKSEQKNQSADCIDESGR